MPTSQHKELVKIHSLLTNHQNTTRNTDPADDASDLDLLRAVVKLVKCWKEQNRVVDSLAFDEKARMSLLNDAQAQSGIWKSLDKFDDQLRRDYTCRRQMILTRLDCTVESFKWKGSDGSEPKGGKAKSKNEQIHETYERARLAMREEPQVGLAHLLATREADCDRLLNHVVSGSRKTDCKIQYGDKSTEMVNLKQVIIPNVPDRGGRPDEVRPPPKETFNRGHRGGSRGRHRK